MKRLLLVFCACVAVLAASALPPFSFQRVSSLPGSGYARYPVRDIALLYTGASWHPKWTPDQAEIYLAHEVDGKKQWLFDGILMLEYCNSATHQFIPMQDDRIPATREEWEEWINDLFTEGRGLCGVDQAITNLKKEIGDPGFRHKVSIALFYPYAKDGKTTWGTLNGKKMNFTKYADQLAVCEWMLDQLLTKWEQAGFKNLDLHSFYWMYEKATDEPLPQAMAKAVKAKGYDFIWCPWYKAEGYNDWKQMGFNVAYLQPNYFFHPTMAKSRLTEACQLAKQYGMALEVEVDKRILPTNEDYSQYKDRFKAYLDVYKQQGVLSSCPLMWYTGEKLLLLWAQNPGKVNDANFDLLARTIIERRQNSALNSRLGL